MRELSVILENLSFSSLVEPFEKNGVSGKTIDRMSSHRTIVNIGNGRIDEVVAQTFYEDYLLEWKQAGGIPRDLLQPTLVPTSSLKVMSSGDTLPHHSYEIIMHGKIICRQTRLRRQRPKSLQR